MKILHCIRFSSLVCVRTYFDFVYFYRTPEEVEEEEVLVAQLKKIESRKKEREKKSHDINKLITAADNKPSLSSHTGSSELGSSSLLHSGDGHHIK